MIGSVRGISVLISGHGPGNPQSALLRADMDILFDKGYITVTREERVEVNNKVKEEYQKGRTTISATVVT